MLPAKKVILARNRKRFVVSVAENKELFSKVMIPKGEMVAGGLEGSITFQTITAESFAGKKKSHGFVVKTFYNPGQPPARQVRLLTALRKIPALRANVVPTARLIKTKKNEYPQIILTDLTKGGKYFVRPITFVRRLIPNYDAMNKEVRRLSEIMDRNKYYPARDIFLVQIDPQTRLGVKVWIVDAGSLKRV